MAAGAKAATLVDSICARAYSATLYAIIHDVILTNCFPLGEARPASEGGIQVHLNGAPLAQVAAEAGEQGFSYNTALNELCLEGGLKKAIGQQYEIFILVDDEGEQVGP